MKPTTTMTDKMPLMMDMSNQMMPQMANWKVGSKYKMIVDAEMISMHKDAGGRFKILSAKSAGESKVGTSDKPATRDMKMARMSEKAKMV